MAERFAVAVVGGGVVGAAVALEMARAGAMPVVVIEREIGLGMVSSARANGGVRAQFSTRANIEFSRYTIAELERLQAEREGLPGLIQSGYLLMAGTERSEAFLRSGYELQHDVGLDVEWLTPEGILEKAPFVRAEGLRAGTFRDKDGIIDPHGVVAAIAAELKAHDGIARLDCDVTAIRQEAGRFTLETSTGEITADWVVNASGAEARQTAAMLGVELPVDPVRRNLACTEAAAGYPNPIPMCVDIDTGVLIRRESAGFLIAYSNPNDPPGTDTSVDPAFFEDLAERLGNRFPFLEDIPIDMKKCWAGLYPETPDHHAIVGPTPGMDRFLHAVGFGGHGIMHSLAAGRALAEVVTLGRSETLDIHPLRFARFAEGDLIVEGAVL